MKISVITPSFNQGAFLERTLNSVLDQRGDFELEHIVVDGASTDNSLDILRRYGSRLKTVSEPDKGQSDALNKGFRLATGDVFGWLNSDDTYEPGALAVVADEWKRKPFAWCFGNCRTIDGQDREIRRWITRYKEWHSRRYSFKRLLSCNFLSQPSIFVSRKAIDEAGDIDVALRYAMDYEFFLRLARLSDPVYIDRYLANFRWHGGSKSGTAYAETARVAYECAKKHAPKGARRQLVMNYLHYKAISIVYSLI